MLYKFDQCSGRIQAMPHHDKEFMNFVTASELLVCMDLQYRSETSPDKYFVTIRWYISKPDSRFWRELELALPIATLTTVSIMEKVIVVKVYQILGNSSCSQWQSVHSAIWPKGIRNNFTVYMPLHGNSIERWRKYSRSRIKMPLYPSTMATLSSAKTLIKNPNNKITIMRSSILKVEIFSIPLLERWPE